MLVPKQLSYGGNKFRNFDLIFQKIIFIISSLKRTKISVGPYGTRLAVIEPGSLVLPEILTGIERLFLVGSVY